MTCLDCGAPSEAMPLDCVIPREQWLTIHPDDGGTLCAACIVRRAAKVPGVINVTALITFGAQYAEGRETPYQAVSRIARGDGDSAAHHRPPPRYRVARFDAAIAQHRVHLEVGEYTDGRPCSIKIDMAKEGSDYRGIMEAFAASATIGLQHGVPLWAFVEDWMGRRFSPAGDTDDPKIPTATSILDWIARRLLAEYPQHAVAPAAPFVAAAAE